MFKASNHSLNQLSKKVLSYVEPIKAAGERVNPGENSLGSGRSSIKDLQGSSMGEMQQMMNMAGNAAKEATGVAVAAQKDLNNAKAGGFGGVVTGGTERGGFTAMGATNQPEKGSYWDAGSGVTKSAGSFSFASGGGGGGGGYGGGGRERKTGGMPISPGYKKAMAEQDLEIENKRQQNQLKYQQQISQMESSSKQKDRDFQMQMEREKDARQSASEMQRMRAQGDLEDRRLQNQSALEMAKLNAQTQANMQSGMMQGMFGMLGGMGSGSSSGYRYW